MKHENRKKQRHVFLFHVEDILRSTEKRSSLQPLIESIRVAVSLVVVAVLFDRRIPRYCCHWIMICIIPCITKRCVSKFMAF